MRYLVGEHNDAASVFLVTGDTAVNLTELSPEIGTDLMGLINTPGALEPLKSEIANAPQIAVSDIVPALPVERPGKTICLGLNYVDHVKEGGYEIPTYPALFMRGRNSLMPAGAPMVRPTASEKLDYEVELMVIIGIGGRHIKPENAYNHVFGYTLFNDGSVRDYQRKTHQWTPGKNFDNTGAVGPIVVTPDELPDGCAGLKIQSRIGTDVMQSANTSEMMWPVDKTIATISEFATLEPGDMIAMGTPPGVGHARTPPRFLKPGDVISVEIEGIGVCSNPVVDETP
ncbi:fumarylacetoacetate hydrolase family protein [Amylibacter sp. IMCC11727]|uniref:fumarylacetoacetate hydrolase family protein n=1 Tax=Amylibacter sp. IMCC11727 TaxID=3039851 RepID=UPI00244E1D8D|nr:fumarylacetoacetate hydrolase family protein [Amylibacter sp. IMCC11727]WGI20593.1 fumarylacetoacetate hydrolase family protein [Amylibacter sp. IMCC11727]